MMLAWVVSASVLAFVLFGLDKLLAQLEAWRIPEATLLALTLAGGGFGAGLAMVVFRHKTRHGVFWLIVVGSCGGWAFVLNRGLAEVLP